MTQPGTCENVALHKRLMQAIADPGQFLPRGGDYTESIPSWSARAVECLLVPAGHGWCPVHGEALCPEDYMLFRDGTVAPGYREHWSESMRCGKRQPTYRVADSGGSS